MLVPMLVKRPDAVATGWGSLPAFLDVMSGQNITVLVSGGRVGFSRIMVRRVLDILLGEHLDNITLVEGEAMGVDQAAARWALARGVPVRPFAIDNALDGDDECAPKRRNVRMFEETCPQIVLGFPGGPGTRHMLTYAHENGAVILDVELDDDGTIEVHEWPKHPKPSSPS